MKNGVFHALKEIKPTTKKQKQKIMGGNKQIISYESTVLWTQPSWGVSSLLDWFWWPWSCTCGWERRNTQESRDYHVYNNAQATRLAVKGLGTRLHQEYRKMMKPFFFQFSLFVFWWSLMEKYLFTFRHWNWLSLSALTRTSVGFFRGNILFRVGKKIISKKISHRKRKCLFPVYNCYFYVKEKPICWVGNRK